MGTVFSMKGLSIAAGLMAIALTSWALLERAGRFAAVAEVERARVLLVRERDQVQVLASGISRCNAGVDQAKQISDSAIATMAQLLAKAEKLAAPKQGVIERIETIIHQAPKPGEGCDWAWDQLEAEHRKARGSP